MTTEVRDRLAGLGRWRWCPETRVWQHDDADEGQVDHPIPDDLNTCAAMWDKHAGRHGFWLECGMLTMEAHGDSTQPITVERTGYDAASFCRDWFRLLGEVLKARGVW